jgi:hypothetical protein
LSFSLQTCKYLRPVNEIGKNFNRGIRDLTQTLLPNMSRGIEYNHEIFILRMFNAQAEIMIAITRTEL